MKSLNTSHDTEKSKQKTIMVKIKSKKQNMEEIDKSI